MLLLDHTRPAPKANLACDEALLNGLDKGAELLRFWESPNPFVVLGRGSRVAEEVDRAACEAAGAPIERRVSGGATVLAGPGCLMYALLLDLEKRPELADVTRAHTFVLGVLAKSLGAIEPSACCAGTNDLTFAPEGDDAPLRKFAGNSVRMTRSRLLYHGAVLYDFDLGLIERWLLAPPRQPDYRERRPHGEFVANLPTTAERLRETFATAWGADEAYDPTGLDSEIDRLVSERYSQESWTFGR
ncbi:putative lipoate-protein ligase A [Pseudobythopirellula maris]|uniref:Putative lipoate-protein ligase A n=1 Tax=Pseudobythopirellula maris TaxID=2527991 RepID=A0A5C5ZUV8_9BACT|nr:lipoate--protein ligase family protein [Pseudobythopirellula maris]TWT91020.1 putative lipoate-protein ligase A [Pseudobythopirellula maris]